MVKKAVLFDLDNTLTHRKKSIGSFAETFFSEYGNRLLNPQISEIASIVMDADNGGYLQPKTLFHSIKDLISHALLFQLQWVDRPTHEDIREFWTEFMPRSSVPMNGAVEVLNRLKDHSYLAGVVSNGAQNSRESVIKALNIGNTIDILVSSGGFGVKKPDPAIFKFALDQLGVDPSNTWFVGDHPINDVVGSRNTGLTPIWLSGFHVWPKDYEAPKYTINSLREISIEMLRNGKGAKLQVFSPRCRRIMPFLQVNGCKISKTSKVYKIPASLWLALSFLILSPILTLYPIIGYSLSMEYKLVVKHKVIKSIKKLPESIQNRFVALSKDLSEKGPLQPNWPNYSKLSKTEHHCHLSRSWVACWKHEKKTIIIEVYYVGSREKAPY